ncbi:MAG: MerR family transcriptional regulator [Kineosporiaceae bacterium]
MPTTTRGLHAVPAPEPALTVAAVARKLGVAPSTLRTWDRRYGLGPSAHTAGAHRRYTVEDVDRLVVMRRLTLEGVPPSEAAAHALRAQAAPVLTAVRAEPGAAEPSAGEDSAAEPALDIEAPDPACGRAGGGRVIPLGDVTPAARGLARAALCLDTEATVSLIREAVDTWGVVRAWDRVLAPVLAAVGARWAATGEGVEVEHSLCEAVVRVMRGLAEAGGPAEGPRVLLGCSEDDQHSLPVHVLAAALREEGVTSRMFGAGMPARSLVAAVRRSGPAVVFLFARLPVAPDSGQAGALDEIPRQRPTPHLVLGGPGWHGVDVPRHARLVHDLGSAVDEIVSLVG